MCRSIFVLREGILSVVYGNDDDGDDDDDNDDDDDDDDDYDTHRGQFGAHRAGSTITGPV